MGAIGQRKPSKQFNTIRNSSYNLLNPRQPNPLYQRENTVRSSQNERNMKARVQAAPRDSGMGSILSYSNALTYREDSSRMGGVA